MNVNVPEVEELLIGLILEGKVDGRIDQVSMRLELDRKYVRDLSTLPTPPFPLSYLSRITLDWRFALSF